MIFIVPPLKKGRPTKIRRVDGGGSSAPPDIATGQPPAPTSFSEADLRDIQFPREDALVVHLLVNRMDVSRVLISEQSSTNIIFWDTFNKFTELKLNSIEECRTSVIVGLDGKKFHHLGWVDLQVTGGGFNIIEEFQLIDTLTDTPSPYNLIMGRGWIYRVEGEVVSNLYLKCPLRMNIKCEPLEAKQCYEMACESMDAPKVAGNGYNKAAEWKKLNSEELGIDMSMINKPTQFVINGLKEKGFEVYLVGGCVRDLILKRTPRDFDIITSARFEKIRKIFPRQCEIVGRKFPICKVSVDDTIVEVSSFSTVAGIDSERLKDGLGEPAGRNEFDDIRQRNCLHRDFTINGLFLDTRAKIVYDYIGGVEDIEKAKVRTIVHAEVSFDEDCARILRGVRIAARLGFHFSSNTALSLKEFSSSVRGLDKRRIFMEMNNMLAFGSAKASLLLLRRCGLLEILLPFQASYFTSKGLWYPNMLLELFSNLDKLVAPDRPCHNSLWISILAFHRALVDKPRDPLVVAVFSLAVQNGGSLIQAVKSVEPPNFFELDERPKFVGSGLYHEVIDLEAYVVDALRMMTSQVFIPIETSEHVRNILKCITFKSVEGGSVNERERQIDYKSLALGRIEEVRYVFGKVVLNTIYPQSRAEGLLW